MSRHEIPAKNPAHEIVVGWDHPLKTFFLIVYDKKTRGRTDDAVLVWLGTSYHEIYEIEYLKACLRPHATLTPEMGATLYGDKDEGR